MKTTRPYNNRHEPIDLDTGCAICQSSVPMEAPPTLRIGDFSRRVEALALSPERVGTAKTAFTCRRVPSDDMCTLLPAGTPRAGDLVLARVTRKRQHTRIELANGRKATLFEGDEIIVSYGDRYATDQFESVVPQTLGPCHLVASGGVASEVVQRSRLVRPATEIEPVGLIGGVQGEPLNLASYCIDEATAESGTGPACLAVVGSSMNAGKTSSAAQLVRAFKSNGLRVGAAKITGTGSGGDYWKLLDAGADLVVDFTDGGYVSTYKVPVGDLTRLAQTLVSHLVQADAEVVILEIADGLFQRETAGLMESAELRSLIDGYFLAVTDSLSAAAGVGWMKERHLPLLGVCGTLTRSPLAMREAVAVTNLPVLSLRELASRDLARSLMAAMEVSEDVRVVGRV